MYRIVLACTGIPPDEGPPGAQCIKEEFTRRPCHTNVKCEWNGTQLVLQADNDYDSTGLALMDEFSDAISACLSNAGTGSIGVLSVTVLSDK
jgi:hypothetical protein